MKRVASATPQMLKEATQLEVHPYPQLSARGDGADCSALPEVADFPAAKFPALQRTTLSNGMNVVLAERRGVPLVEAGDVTMDALKPMLETRFQNWARGDVPAKNIAQVEYPSASTVYIMDRPGSEQSIIFAGHVAPPKANPSEFAIESMNNMLGGTFTSRVNVNLREDKGWAYGAFTIMLDAKGQRPFIAYAPVQTDKTRESMQELLAELQGITSAEPVTSDELAKTKNEQTLTLPGRFETISAVSDAVGDIVRFGLPDDYYETYAGTVRALTLTEVNQVAREVVRPSQLVWVVVGDRATIEPEIRQLGFGEVRLLNENGQPIAASE